jgi:uncharacterized protein (TIGR03437 family)
MRLAWTATVALCACAAATSAPDYTAAGIVSAANYQPGPFAPNDVLSIFGTGLAWSAEALAAGDIASGTLPFELNGSRVFVANQAVPLYYVSPTQINFMLPSGLGAGDVPLRVVRQGVTGPQVTITLADAAPELFELSDYALATHTDYSLVTTDMPAHGGETVILFGVGFGKTLPNPGTGAIASVAAPTAAGVQVLLDGTAVPAAEILYAGLTPGSAGLYQINLTLPDAPGTDPEIRVAMGAQTSRAGLKLAVH